MSIGTIRFAGSSGRSLDQVVETGPLPKSTAVSIVGHGGKGYTWLVSSGVPSPLKEESQLRERRPEYDPFSNLCVEGKIVRECIACFALGLVVNSNGGTSVGFLTAALCARLKA